MLNESASDTSIQPYDRENMVRRAAVHEAAHAVAYVLACRALGLNGDKFARVQIRQDLSKPLLGPDGDELEGWGVFLVSPLYTPPSCYAVSVEEVRDFFSRMAPAELTRRLNRMEWEIIQRLAGPIAEAVMFGETYLFALAEGGGSVDFKNAEAVLDDYRAATKRKYGLTRFVYRTRKIVVSAWVAIEALASALLESDVLTYDQAYPIIDCSLPAAA